MTLTPETTIAVFAKYPRPGFCKQRLAATIGDELAAAFAAAAIEDLAAALAGLAVRRCWAYTPDNASARAHFARFAAGRDELWAQPETDLGHRLDACVNQLWSSGSQRVVLIGSDCPALGAAELAFAVESLNDCDAVLGPALDGGYYLLGLRRPKNEAQSLQPLFTGIDWSTDRVADQTRERLRELQLRWRELPPLRDLDTIDDWEWYRDPANQPESLGPSARRLFDPSR